MIVFSKVVSFPGSSRFGWHRKTIFGPMKRTYFSGKQHPNLQDLMSNKPTKFMEGRFD